MKKSKQETNLKIYEILGDFILTYPELRFIQLLWCMGIVNKEDRFYEPSEVTLEKVRKYLTKD